MQGNALSLPFADGAFDRVFTSYFYCHLEPEERARFLAEARRVAPELVVVASIRGAGDEAERWEERQLKDGSLWNGVQARLRAGEDLAAELGGELVFIKATGSSSRALEPAAIRLPVARLAATRPARLPSLRRSGLPARVVTGRERLPRTNAPTCMGRRPGSSKGKSVARGADAPGRRFAAGSSSTRTSSTERSTARP